MTDEKESLSASPKMDAFQFMMNSRNKSIGRNSPGRELDLNESPDSSLPKQDLKARKAKLESWAEQKGASKRKREYDEIGNVISEKLEKRERRLKKMLNINCESEDEVATKRRRRHAVIETDSDNSNDFQEPQIDEIEPKVKRKRRKRKRLSLKKVDSEEIDTEEKVSFTPLFNSWKFKIKICMDEHKANEEEDAQKKKELRKNEEVVNNFKSNGDVEAAVHEQSENPTMDITEKKNDIVLVEESHNDSSTPQSGRVLRTRRTKPKHYADYVLSDEEETPKRKQKEKKDVKVAPVFLKSVHKPKLDPKEVEAKRQFLMSGIPSSLRKELEKQQSLDETQLEVFPAISHIQQKSPNNRLWDLPKANLKLKTQKIEPVEVTPFSRDLLILEDCREVSQEGNSITKIKNIKRVIKEIKAQYPDYPVIKIFNSIYEKSGYEIEENKLKNAPKTTTPKRRGRKKANKPETGQVTSAIKDNFLLWTEKYKPKSSSDIIGNQKSVSFLKDWLANWLKPRKKNETSDSEFEKTDSDSRDSVKLLSNTVILRGPPGCGKTAAVYAICNELNLNVLEINASSKRTGKKLLQELQEATQSHRVYKKDNLLLVTKENNQKPSTKMSILLIEDVDLIFEQDNGFSAALLQIITTSKRPIILTATDEPTCSTIQKIINNNKTLTFVALSPILPIWLQIICLVEGFYLDLRSLENLLSYDKGDIRRTLLHLQFYVNSGGQVKGHEILEVTSKNEMQVDQPVSSGEVVHVHKDFLDISCVINGYKTISLPYSNNLEMIWWNLPSLLNFPNSANLDINKEKLKLLDNCYNSLSAVDIICGKSKCYQSLEPRWSSQLKNGLGLEENMAGFEDDAFPNEVSRFLLGENFSLFREKDSQGAVLELLPDKQKQLWRLKVFSAEEKLQEALLPSDCLAKKALVLDYMPCLRNITRSEILRSVNNTKRGNRFYNYLRNLGVNAKESTYKSVCDIFKIWD